MKATVLKVNKPGLAKSAIPLPAKGKENGFGNVLSVVVDSSSPPGEKVSKTTIQRPPAQQPAVLHSGRYSVAHEESQNNLKEKSKLPVLKEEKQTPKVAASVSSAVTQVLPLKLSAHTSAPYNDQVDARDVKTEANASQATWTYVSKGSNARTPEGRLTSTVGFIGVKPAESETKASFLTDLSDNGKLKSFAKSDNGLQIHDSSLTKQVLFQTAKLHESNKPNIPGTRTSDLKSQTVTPVNDGELVRQLPVSASRQANAGLASGRTSGMPHDLHYSGAMVLRSSSALTEPAVPNNRAFRAQSGNGEVSHTELSRLDGNKIRPARELSNTEPERKKSRIENETGQGKFPSDEASSLVIKKAQEINLKLAGKVEVLSSFDSKPVIGAKSLSGQDFGVKWIPLNELHLALPANPLQAKLDKVSRNQTTVGSESTRRPEILSTASHSGAKVEDFVRATSLASDAQKLNIQFVDNSVPFKQPGIQQETSTTQKQWTATASIGVDVKNGVELGKAHDPLGVHFEGNHKSFNANGRSPEMTGKPLISTSVLEKIRTLSVPESATPSEKADQVANLAKLTLPMFDTFSQPILTRGEERIRRNAETSHGRSEELSKGPGESNRTESSSNSQYVSRSDSGEHEIKSSAGLVREVSVQNVTTITEPKVGSSHQGPISDTLRAAIQQALELSKQRIVEPDELQLSVPLGEMGTIDIDISKESDSYLLKISVDPQAIALLDDQRLQLVSWLRQNGHPVDQITILPRFSINNESLGAHQQMHDQNGKEGAVHHRFSEKPGDDHPGETLLLPKPSLAGGRVWMA